VGDASTRISISGRRLLEVGQPGNQPGCGKGRHGADRQCLPLLGGFQRVHGLFDLVERRQQDRVDLFTGFAQAHFVVAAHKQCHAQTIFQQPDLLADCARGYAQRLGGQLDAAVASDFGKGAQSL